MKKPLVIKSTKMVAFDVDETLIMWEPDKIDPDRELPRHIVGELPVLAHQRHIRLMAEFAARGHCVVVWSKGGWEWAQQAVKALGIEKYVSVIMDKPDWYVDDMPSEKWLGKNIYLDVLNPMKDQSHLDEEDDK